jgi:protein-L-isoaspartate(D-aspartate) O-methyltransferase
MNPSLIDQSDCQLIRIWRCGGTGHDRASHFASLACISRRPTRNEPLMALATTHSPTNDFLADARNRMVDSQIRPNRVSDPRILDAMRRLPRERFLPAAQRALAYADQNVNLGGGRVLAQPMVLAKLLQAAMPLPGETVLVAAAGTGYSAALLSAIGCTVTALEATGPLADLAKSVLADVAPSVTLVGGELPSGWPSGAPFDVILIDGAVPAVPPALTNQLREESGRLVTIINHGDHSGYAVLAEPTPAGVSARALFDCLCPMLPAFAPAPAFQF